LQRRLLSPSQCLALDPGYAAASRPGKKSRQFVCGGSAGKLLLNSRGWLGSKDHLLHSGEGAVRTARWAGALIAWANDAGVKLYDSAAHARIAFLERPGGEAPRADAFPTSLAWDGEATLIIGWADCVTVARVVRGLRAHARRALTRAERARREGGGGGGRARRPAAALP